MTANIRTRQVGALNSLGYRLYFENDKGQVISPFHDIPLFANEAEGIVNMIVEIPRWSNAKLEISTGDSFNPIKQDIKNGKLRFVKNVFPHKGYIWNYGALPQTWEDPALVSNEIKAGGDRDPIDVCEIGERVGTIGQIKQVKILGVMALLDEGETDYKLIAIDVNDPLAPKLNDIEDVERHLPGILRATNEWFRIYKIPDGKPENVWALNGEARNKAYALQVLKETHEAWRKLVEGKTVRETDKYKIDATNLTVAGSPFKVSADDAVAAAIPAASPKPAESIDVSVDKWFYVAAMQANL